MSNKLHDTSYRNAPTQFDISRLIERRKGFPYFQTPEEGFQYPFVSRYTGKPHAMGLFQPAPQDNFNRLGRDIRSAFINPTGKKLNWTFSDPVRATAISALLGSLAGAGVSTQTNRKDALLLPAVGALLGGGTAAGIHYYLGKKK